MRIHKSISIYLLLKRVRFPPNFLVWYVVWSAYIINRWALVHLVYELDHGHQYVSDIYTNFIRSNARA